MNIRLSYDGTITNNPIWSDVEKALEILKDEADMFLRIVPEPEKGPSSLQVQSENGYYLPVLSTADEGVREYINLEAEGEEPIEIQGYIYDAMTVTQDYDLIVRMVKEFYETGDVSRDLLK